MFQQIKKIKKYCSGYLNFLLGKPAIQINRKLEMSEVLRVVKSGSIWEKYQLLPSFIIGKRRLTRFQSLLLLGGSCFAGIVLSCYFDNVLPFLFLLGIAIILDSAVTFESGEIGSLSIASMSSTHFVIACNDFDDLRKGKVIAGYITGTTVTISLDTAVDFETDWANIISIVSMSSTHFVIAFQDVDDGNRGKVIAGSLSGVTITIAVDTAVTFETGITTEISLASMSGTHFVVAFRDNDDFNKGKVIAGSLSGVTITIAVDTATIFETGGINYISLASMSSTHFVIAFTDTGNSNKGKVIAGSLSGVIITITLDTATIFETGATKNISLASMSSTHFVIAFQDDADSDKGKVIAGSLSGITITIIEDGATTFETGWFNHPSIISISAISFVIVFSDGLDSAKGKAINGYISGTTIKIILDSAVTFESGLTYYLSAALMSNFYFIAAFVDITDSSKGKVIAGRVIPPYDPVYPASNYDPREKENKSGVTYTPANKTVGYADDVFRLDGEVKAIQQELGINPRGAYATVKAWLSALASTFLGLSDTPANYTDQAEKILKVNAGEDALEFTDKGASVFTGLTDTPANYTDQADKIPRVNAGENALEFLAAFLGLADTPASYSGQAGKIPRVNAGENALEFLAAFLGLADTPASYSGQSLKSVRVNTGETALEFTTPAKLDYTEKFVNFNAVGDNAWEEKDLSGDGVPANAVCEIAIGNDKANAELNGGVRATDSALNRYLLIQEAEAGGLDLVTMHVKADANSKIDIFAQEAGNMTFYLLGYWN